MWGQLCSLARLQIAVRSGPPRATTVVYSAHPTVRSGSFSVSPCGTVAAVHKDGTEPAFCAPLQAGITELAAWSPHTTEAWSPCGTQYACMPYHLQKLPGRQGWWATVTVYDCAGGGDGRTFHLPRAGGGYSPGLAWSRCKRHLLVVLCSGCSATEVHFTKVHVLNVGSQAVHKIKIVGTFGRGNSGPMQQLPGAAVWHPLRCQLVGVCHPSILKLFSFETDRVRCVARLNVYRALLAVGSWPADPSLMDPRLAFSCDGSQVILGFAFFETHFAAVQLTPSPTLLWTFRTAMRMRELSLCAGPGLCAASGEDSGDGYSSVLLFSLANDDEAPIGPLLKGSCPAFSPCGAFLAVVRQEGDAPDHIAVLSLKTYAAVRTWAPSQLFPLQTRWGFACDGFASHRNPSLLWLSSGELQLYCVIWNGQEDCPNHCLCALELLTGALTKGATLPESCPEHQPSALLHTAA